MCASVCYYGARAAQDTPPVPEMNQEISPAAKEAAAMTIQGQWM